MVERIGPVAVDGLLDHLLYPLFGFCTKFFKCGDGRGGAGPVAVPPFQDDEGGVGGALGRRFGASHCPHPGHAPSSFEFDVQFLQSVVSLGAGPYD